MTKGTLTATVKAATDAVSAQWAKENALALTAHEKGNTKLAMIHARRANRFRSAAQYGVNFVDAVSRIETSEDTDAALIAKAGAVEVGGKGK